MAEEIKMSFPADTGYISTIRLAVSGVAGKLDFALDEIEDLKSCVSEACLLILCGQVCKSININITVDEGIKMNVEGAGARAGVCEDCSEFNEEISRIMIEALSEDACFDEKDGLLNAISFSKSHAG
jgi:hypothetical protein